MEGYVYYAETALSGWEELTFLCAQSTVFLLEYPICYVIILVYLSVSSMTSLKTGTLTSIWYHQSYRVTGRK